MLTYAYIFVGILILFYSGEVLVKNSSVLAKSLGLSQFFIGLTVVSLGTSLPELFVSLAAALKNSDQISIGNIIGSNIANLGLVLGLVFVFCKAQDNKVSNINKFFLLLSTFLFFIVSLYGVFLRIFAVIFLFIFILFMFYSLKESASLNKVEEKDSNKNNNLLKNIILVFLSILGLYFGSSLLVNNGVILAKTLGVSELLIGVTVMAVGTSLPELTASMVALLRKNYDISIANIIGSNIFNVFFILPIVSLFKPLQISSSINYIEFPILFFMSFALIYFIRNLKIKKIYGFILMLSYLLYIILFLYRK